MVWESTDLVHWSDQRMVRVSPPTAGNTWAPEAYWDASRGEFVVFWASKLYSPDDPEHAGDSYNRMMYATTTGLRELQRGQGMGGPWLLGHWTDDHDAGTARLGERRSDLLDLPVAPDDGPVRRGQLGRLRSAVDRHCVTSLAARRPSCIRMRTG